LPLLIQTVASLNLKERKNKHLINVGIDERTIIKCLSRGKVKQSGYRPGVAQRVPGS
jgi:hypothetical protein